MANRGKAKNNKAAWKRFRFTGSGEVRRNKAYKSHILLKKSRKRKRNLRQSTIMEPQDAKHVKGLLPYR
jgi:large subunit ribosomal protein L35